MIIVDHFRSFSYIAKQMVIFLSKNESYPAQECNAANAGMQFKIGIIRTILNNGFNVFFFIFVVKELSRG